MSEYMPGRGYDPGPLYTPGSEDMSEVEDLDIDEDDDDDDDDDYTPQLNTIIQLSDAEGTKITIKPPTQYEEVIKEFQAAWAEKRLMRVWMERKGYTYRVNPQQVAYIQQLEY